MAGDDRRSPLSVGLVWSARASMLGVEFALPVFLGHYIDLRLGTSPIALFVGMILGFVVGMMHLLRIARDASKPNQP
jgi:F0F1-type ATP synthase assembly protein I